MNAPDGFAPKRRQDDALEAEVKALRLLVEEQATFIRRRLHPGILSAIVGASISLGGGVVWGLNFMGVKWLGPGLVNEQQDQRIGNVEIRVDGLATILTRYVISNCLDSTQAARLREAQMPCQRMIDDAGIQRRPFGP